jgi:hypothetical protein
LVQPSQKIFAGAYRLHPMTDAANDGAAALCSQRHQSLLLTGAANVGNDR